MLGLLDGPPVGPCIQIFRQLFLQKLPTELQFQLASVDPNIFLHELADHADRIVKAKPLMATTPPPIASFISSLSLGPGQQPLGIPQAQGHVNVISSSQSHVAALEARINTLGNTIYDLVTRIRTLESRPTHFQSYPPPSYSHYASPPPQPFPLHSSPSYPHYPRSPNQRRRSFHRPPTPHRQPVALPYHPPGQTSSPPPSTPTHDQQGICLNHQKWGAQTRNCLKPCTFQLNSLAMS